MRELRFKNINLFSPEGNIFKTLLCNEYNNILSYYNSRIRLNDYQRLASGYFQPNSRYNSLLVYHGTGLGKTATAINSINNILAFTAKLNIIIICPAILKNTTWIPQLNKYLNNKDIAKLITFISVDSPTFVTDFDVVSKTISSNISSLIIIDECHIFFSSLLDDDSNRKVVYNQLLNIVKNYKTFLICLTATPIVNQIEEVVLMMNLLRPDTFHVRLNLFQEIFLSAINGRIKNQHIFCKRITGLVSYFETERHKDMPSVNNNTISLPMSNEQLETYIYVEAEETKKGGGYKQKSISMCNFAPPLKLIQSGVNINLSELINNATTEELAKMSPKFVDIISKIKTSKRPNVVHSSFVKSTLVPFELYLLKYGFNKTGENSVRVVTGETNQNDRDTILNMFNSSDNMYGKIIKVLIISDVFSAGVTIKHVENLFVINYHWNSAKIKQVYGRVERLTTHVDLPIEDRFVNKYIYVMTKPTGTTADQLLERTSLNKDIINDMFLHLMKISSIDIEFNKQNRDFIYKNEEPFKVSLDDIFNNKQYIYRSITDEENIFQNNVSEISLTKLNTRKINVVYFDDKQIKQQLTCLLIYPIIHYFLVDINYFNYIGKLRLDNNKPIFDRDTNFLVADIVLN